MCQIAGGAIGLGINTAIVTSASSLEEGVRNAFFVDAGLGLLGLIVVLSVIPARHPAADPSGVTPPRRFAHHLRHIHRANA